MAETVFNYRQHLWRNITLVAALGLIISYVIYSAKTVPQGGTVVGLLYGILGLLAILLLMFYGIRKRSYGVRKHSSGLKRFYYATITAGALQAWLSSHVWIGLLTLLIIPLHAGFRFAVDVHTLAYVLLVVVVVSGLVGVTLYGAIPRRFRYYGDELAQVDEHGIDSADTALNTIIAHIRVLREGKSAGIPAADL